MPIGVPSNQFDVGKKALPSRLMLTAVDAGTTEVVAILSVVQSTDARICMLNGDGNRCSMYDVARLIALFALDDQHQILPVQLMPPRQPCAVLLKSGQLGIRDCEHLRRGLSQRSPESAEHLRATIVAEMEPPKRLSGRSRRSLTGHCRDRQS